MHTMKLVLVPACLILAAACSDSATGPTAPEPPVALSQSNASGPPITVMTRNLYVGADVDAVIFALATPDPGDDLPSLMAAIATLQATDFPARARAIAGEIAERRPEVLGLQEVYQLRVDLTALGLPVDINLDFLQILQQALDERHLRYVVAAKVRDTEAAPFPGISLVDYDVVLIDRDRVRIEGDVIARQFAYNIGPVAPGVDIRRGFIVFQARINGRLVTVANTHLESGNGPQLEFLRAAQATELAGALGTSSPVVLTGDLNDVPGSPMYQVLAGSGLVDAWSAFGGGDAGLTCCHAPDLSNPLATFTQRLDYVWERGFGHGQAGVNGRAMLTGLRPQGRIAGPAGLIWPSDHAGLVVELR